MQPVAVLGLGRMGSAMARRLHQSGFEVTVWNRTQATADALAEELGAAVARSPAEAARGAGVVVASLADDDALAAVHAGEEGTLAGATDGTVVVDTSTVSPEAVAALAPRFAALGAHLLDAPVSGSTALVEQGTLTVMVGGDPAALEVARPILDALATKVFHLGENGAGATMKLAVNAFVHAINLALSESLVMAEAAGIDRKLAYEVLASGAGASPYVLYKRQAFEDPEGTPVAFTLDLVAKDLDLILGLARRLGVPTNQADVTAHVVAETLAAGMGSRDMSALAEHFRRSSP